MKKIKEQIRKMIREELTEQLDTRKIKTILRKLQDREGKFRNTMYKLDDQLNREVGYKELSKKLRMSYKDNVTKFMRELISIVKKAT
jgi:hypothetical protein|tara:strand:- start:124 stop:384 length:261 start_codon:yes stop_codon:yes gene_type:complete